MARTRTAPKDYSAWAVKPDRDGARVHDATPEARARAILSGVYGPDTPEARDARWHTARAIRTRYRHPASWLDCLGLADVPTAPAGWCNCPAADAESEAA